MDIFSLMLNLVAPPFIWITIVLLFPIFIVYNLLYSVVASLFPENITGKVVVVTGASSGIGEELAYEYARQGACMAIVARREKRLVEVAHICLQLGAQDVIIVAADVSQNDDCKRVIDTTISHFGRLDHLVCNAGISAIKLVEEYEDISKAKSIMDVNFWGSVFMARFAIPHLRATKGKLLAVSSIGSYPNPPKMSLYNASKSAMIAFFETLRVELWSEVHVTIATPGFVASEIMNGKMLTCEGKLEMDLAMKKDHIGGWPVGKANECAKRMVNTMRRRQRDVTYPQFYIVTRWLKQFLPQLTDWLLYVWLYTVMTPGISIIEAMIIKIVGLKSILNQSMKMTTNELKNK